MSLCCVCNLNHPNLIVPCRCRKYYHPSCLNKVRISSAKKLVQCTSCECAYFVEKVSVCEVGLLLLCLVVRICTVVLSFLVGCHLVLYLSSRILHFLLMKGEVGYLTFRQYIDIFVLVKDPELLASYVPISYNFWSFYAGVVIAILVIIGLWHLVHHGLPHGGPFHCNCPDCQDCPHGTPNCGKLIAGLLFLLVMCLASLGVYVLAIATKDLLSLFLYAQYEKWVREKDALLNQVQDVRIRDAPRLDILRKGNFWPEKHLDKMVLTYLD
jgi:hypothetical protein